MVLAGAATLDCRRWSTDDPCPPSHRRMITLDPVYRGLRKFIHRREREKEREMREQKVLIPASHEETGTGQKGVLFISLETVTGQLIPFSHQKHRPDPARPDE